MILKSSNIIFTEINDGKIAPIADVMLMSFALDAGKYGHEWQNLLKNHDDLLPIESAPSALEPKQDFGALAIDDARKIYGNQAAMLMAFYHYFAERLCLEKLYSLYQLLDIPLSQVLYQIERRGILLDADYLKKLSQEFAEKIAAHQIRIYQLAGEEFNIGSPKQLGQILFEKLNLPKGRKTKTGQYSTDNDLLDELTAEGFEIASLVQDWRHISKLRSTYSEILPVMQEADGRVRTRFNIAGAQTGRLSSVDPNLQNIPVRDSLGKKIRQAFIAPKGKLLLSLDYSQIELRLLAHIAELDSMISAFRQGVDIHQFTASEVFEVPLESVSDEQRRNAKAVNFGIIYGISAFGLARQLGISREQAKQYINLYLARYQGLQSYMDSRIEMASKLGFTQTLWGRKTYFPTINDRNHAKRNYAARQAINAPIQGSAADIIKQAMIEIEAVIAQEGLPASLLLQVHDELVFEAPEASIDALAERFQTLMVAAAGDLSVPLMVDIGVGKNWAEAH